MDITFFFGWHLIFFIMDLIITTGGGEIAQWVRMLVVQPLTSEFTFPEHT